jgi:hypothetical protein
MAKAQAKKSAPKDVKPRAKQAKSDPSGIRELTDNELGAVTGGGGGTGSGTGRAAASLEKVYKPKPKPPINVW